MGRRKINLKSLSFTQNKSAPVAFLVVILLSFGLFVPRLGFYWDDWPSIWFLHAYGAQSFLEGFASDRPLLAWVFILTSSLVGESTVAWQAFGLLARWISTLAFWWNLKLLWPEKTWQITAASLIFAIFPGFRQQYISVTYSNALIVFSIFLTSFALMIMAQKRPRARVPLIAGSIITSGFSMFISEYFFGLELVRPILLWVLVNKNEHNWKRKALRTLKYWSPYLTLMAAFLYWRLVLHPTPRGNLIFFEQFKLNPLGSISTLLATILQDIYEITFLSFINSVKVQGLEKFGLLAIGMYALIVLATTALAFLYLSRLKSTSESEAPSPKHWISRWANPFLGGGVFCLLVGGWPFWLTDLHIELIFPWDRFTVSLMIGVCLVVVGLLEAISLSQAWRAVILAILLGATAGMHFYDGMEYRKEWLQMQSMFWQLTWRAPAVAPGTAFLTSDLPFTHYSDNSLTAPLNWTYAPDQNSEQMPYLVYDIESRLGEFIPSLEEDVAIYQPYRKAYFQGTTSQAIVFFYDPPRCVKVLDPIADRQIPYKPHLIPDTLPLSNTRWIIPNPPNPAHPPVEFFGQEPPPNWCYYFEKAELASQMEDWKLVVDLGERALSLDKEFSRETASELIPFIKGYAHTSQWQKALELSLRAYQAGEKMQNILCQTWYSFKEDTIPSAAREAAYEELDKTLGCDFP